MPFCDQYRAFSLPCIEAFPWQTLKHKRELRVEKYLKIHSKLVCHWPVEIFTVNIFLLSRNLLTWKLHEIDFLFLNEFGAEVTPAASKTPKVSNKQFAVLHET